MSPHERVSRAVDLRVGGSSSGAESSWDRSRAYARCDSACAEYSASWLSIVTHRSAHDASDACSVSVTSRSSRTALSVSSVAAIVSESRSAVSCLRY